VDPVSIASSLVVNGAAAQADLMAVKLLKMNADASQNVLDLLDAASRSMDAIQASLGPGMGGNLDVTV
jgi:hypothetical protein